MLVTRHLPLVTLYKTRLKINYSAKLPHEVSHWQSFYQNQIQKGVFN
jgi:hypothetical protein